MPVWGIGLALKVLYCINAAEAKDADGRVVLSKAASKSHLKAEKIVENTAKGKCPLD